MNEKNQQLVELLRAADPAADAPELTDAQVGAIRRAALRALPAARGSWLAAPAWSAALAAAAVALLALAVLVALRLATPEGPTTSAGRAPSIAAPAPAATSAAPVPKVATEPPASASHIARLDSAAATPAPHRPRLAARSAAAPAVEVAAVAPPERAPVQLLLTAPGGTRIVWVLGPPTNGG